MIRLALALAAAIGLAAPALAVTVRSGEHADRSRIVLYFDPLPDYTFGRVPGGYELRPSGPPPDYALGGVFDLIPRTRIATLEAGDGRLRFGVDCACHADVFAIPQGLVVDIVDGPPPPDSPFEAVLPTTQDRMHEIVAATAPLPADSLPDVFLPMDEADPLEWAALPGPAGAPEPGARDEAMRQGSAPGAPFPPAPDPPEASADPARAATPFAAPGAEGMDAARQALIEQIGRAASQGLVEPDLEASPAPPPPVDDPPAETATAPDAPPATLPGLEDRPNVRIETAIERARDGLPDRAPMTAEGGRCLPADRLDVRSWGTPPEDGQILSGRRAQLLDPFDAADPDAVVALAREYVYLTFGAEALALLDSFGLHGPDTALLRTLAEIVDAGVARAPTALSEQVNCHTPAALWAMLSRADPPLGRPVDKAAVIEGFALLPLHMRRHLGPGLADRFRRAGDIDTASTIRNAIARAPGDTGPGLAMLEARIALDQGKTEAGADALARIVADDGALAPEAVEVLIATRIAAGDPVPAPLLDNAAALAFEYRGTPRGQALQISHLRGLLANRAFDEALAQLSRLGDTEALPDPVRAELHRDAMARLAADAPDATFLAAALAEPDRWADGAAAAEVRRVVARRLLSLGLPAPARAVLDRAAVDDPADRLLHARSHLLDRRPQPALAHLEGLDSPPARALRAEALTIGRDFDDAATIYADLGDTEGLARAARRAADWARLAEVGRGPERRTAELAVAPASHPPGAAPSLAAARDLIERTRTARDALDAMLADMPRP